jgi:hypothetical protein
MSKQIRKNPWGLRVIAATTISGCFVLAAIAQPVETPIPKTQRVDKIEQLVKKGQLTMIEAVKMAEARTKGVAFQARSVVRPGPFANPQNEKATSDEPNPDEERLIYKIICVLDSQPTTVVIDGKEKKIVSPPKPPTPGPGPAPSSEPNQDEPAS